LALSTYHDDKAGIRIDYPSRWKSWAGLTDACINWQTGEPQYGITFSPDRLDALPQVNACVFSGFGLSAAETASFVGDFLAQYESGIVQDERFSGFEVTRRWDDLTIDGRPAAALGYSASATGVGDVFAVVMVTSTDEDFYLVTWAGTTAEQSETTARFETMRETIRFLR